MGFFFLKKGNILKLNRGNTVKMGIFCNDKTPYMLQKEQQKHFLEQNLFVSNL